MIRAFRQSPNSEYARAATRSLRESISINERLQTGFGPYVSFVVLPLFALGQRRRATGRATRYPAAVRSPLTWGIVAGLVVGKLVGITGATALVRATGIGQLAPGLTLRRVAGGAALSGIGFTIALFIVDIAIADPVKQDEARSACWSPPCSRLRSGLGRLPRHRLDQPAGVRGRQADSAGRPRPRPHPWQPGRLR